MGIISSYSNEIEHLCITSQLLFVPTNMLLKRYLACRIFSNVSHTVMQGVYPDIHTLIKLMLTISFTTASMERCLSRWWCYKYTWEITAEKNGWIAIAPMILQRNSELLKINIGHLAQQTTPSTAQFQKDYLWNTTLDWSFNTQNICDGEVNSDVLSIKKNMYSFACQVFEKNAPSCLFLFLSGSFW